MMHRHGIRVCTRVSISHSQESLISYISLLSQALSHRSCSPFATKTPRIRALFSSMLFPTQQPVCQSIAKRLLCMTIVFGGGPLASSETIASTGSCLISNGKQAPLRNMSPSNEASHASHLIVDLSAKVHQTKALGISGMELGHLGPQQKPHSCRLFVDLHVCI